MSEQEVVDAGSEASETAADVVTPAPVEGSADGGATETAPEQAAPEGDAGATETADTGGLKLTSLQRHVAERAHLTDEMLQKLGDAAPAVLEQLKASQDAVSSQFARLGAKAVPKEDAKPAGKALPAKPAEEPEAPEEPADGKFSLGIKFEDYEEDAADALRKVEAKMAQLAKTRPQFDEESIAQAVIQRLQPLLGGLQQQHLRERERETDAFFAAIKDDFGDVYGDLPNRDVQDGTDIAQRRTELLRMAVQIHAGMQEAGEEATWKESLSRALSVTQRDRQKTIARRELMNEVKGRQKQISPTPARRGAANLPPGRERAIKNLLARRPELRE